MAVHEMRKKEKKEKSEKKEKKSTTKYSIVGDPSIFVGLVPMNTFKQTQEFEFHQQTGKGSGRLWINKAKAETETETKTNIETNVETKRVKSEVKFAEQSGNIEQRLDKTSPDYAQGRKKQAQRLADCLAKTKGGTTQERLAYINYLNVYKNDNR